MNNKYRVNFKKLALMVLPPFLRRRRIVSLVYAAMFPLSRIYNEFYYFFTHTMDSLKYNGQICYLRAILNKMFDPDHKRIYIIDMYDETEGRVLLMRENRLRKEVVGLRHEGEAFDVLERRRMGGEYGVDFRVVIPQAVLEEDKIGNLKNRAKAITNQYKLASKRFTIN